MQNALTGAAFEPGNARVGRFRYPQSANDLVGALLGNKTRGLVEPALGSQEFDNGL